MNRPISALSKCATIAYLTAMVALSAALASRSDAQVGRAIWFEVVEFETGVPTSDSLGHIHLGTETLTNNTSVQISWGDGTTSNAPILGRVTYINDKGYDLTRAGDYRYNQPAHFYRKAGAYTVTATLTALPAGTTNPADKYVDTATVTARDRSPVNRLTASVKTVAGARVVTIDTVLAANIPAGTAVNYSLLPNRKVLGQPFVGNAALVRIGSPATQGTFDVPVLSGAPPGTYTLTAVTVGTPQRTTFRIP